MRTSDILDSLNIVLAELKPDFKIYVRFQPQGLSRPALFCEHIRSTSPSRLCRKVYGRRSVFQIVYFAPTDDFYRPDRLGLYDVADDIVEALSDGFITVGDRAPRVTAETAEVNGREAFITVSVDYTEKTAGAIQKEQSEAASERMRLLKIKNGRGIEYGNTTDQY